MTILAPTPPRLGRVNLARQEQDAAAARGQQLIEQAARQARVWGVYKARGVTPEVARRKVLLRLRLDAQKQTRAITARLLRGELTRDAWQRQMRAVLIPSHYAAALAGTGLTKFDARTLAAAQSSTRTQLGYLARFKAEIGTGQQASNGTLLSRADLYGAAVWTTGQAVRADQARAEGHREEIGVLGKHDSCESCLDRESKGWQPIGTLLPIGAGLCRSRCGCHMEYRGGRDGSATQIPGRKQPSARQLQPQSESLPLSLPPRKIAAVPPTAETAPGYGGLAEGITFSRPEVAQQNPRYHVVLVDVAKFDRSLAGDPTSYVGPGGVGPTSKPGAYANAKAFILRAKERGTQVDMPRVHFDARRPGEVGIGDGRHRWAVLRDEGAKTIPVTVSRGEVAAIRRKFGLATPVPGSGVEAATVATPAVSGEVASGRSLPSVRAAVRYAADVGVDVVPDGKARIEASLGPDRTRNVPAVFHRKSGAVLINEDHPYWQDPAGTMAKAGKSGWFSSSEPDHIIVHEVAHAQHYQAIGNEKYELVKGAKFKPEQLAKIKGKVSHYAETQPIEFVAEVSAGLKAGKVYDDDVTALHRKLGGPKL